MKRFFIFSMLVMLFAGLTAQSNNIQFNGYGISPVTMDYTIYDYMNGAYDGYPMRIADGNYSHGERGVYMTYMVRASTSQRRFQHFRVADLYTGQSLATNVVLSTQAQQGFGTLAVDPRTGNAFFSWHQFVDGWESFPPDDVPIDTYINFDMSEILGFGGGLPVSAGKLGDNLVNNFNYSYQWPVVHIGDSPYPDMKRLYVFTMNGGATNQPTTGNASGFVPSSSVKLYMTDLPEFMAEYAEDGIDLVNNLPWIEVEVPYLIDFHEWVPVDYSDPNNALARGYPSYAVAPTGGVVAISGAMSYDDEFEVPQWWNDAWGEYRYHDHFLLVNNNYGVGDWTVHVYPIETDYTERTRPLTPDGLGFQHPMIWHPGNATIPEGPIDADHPDDQGDDYPNEYGYWTNGTSNNHKNMTIDSHNRLHFGSSFEMAHTSTTIPPGYYRPTRVTHVVHNITMNLNNGDVDVFTVYPRHSNLAMGKSPIKKAAFTWDLDHDGFWDDERIEWSADLNYWDTGWMWEWVQAIQFYNENAESVSSDNFNYNFFRLTQESNGVMAMLWMDTAKSHLYQVAPSVWPEFAAYERQPEVFVAVTIDYGRNWSHPYVFSAMHPDHSSLVTPGYNPANFYLADKIIHLDENNIRLWVMYVDDQHFGSTVQNDGGNGAYLKYAAMDFYIGDLVSDKDITVEKPQPKLLAQNYPNPFNPTTTISFDVPKTGDVKLSVYNVKGQLVKTLVDDNMVAGRHQVVWNGIDNNDRSVASGVYFYRLETNGTSEMKKMVLMK